MNYNYELEQNILHYIIPKYVELICASGKYLDSEPNTFIDDIWNVSLHINWIKIFDRCGNRHQLLSQDTVTKIRSSKGERAYYPREIASPTEFKSLLYIILEELNELNIEINNSFISRFYPYLERIVNKVQKNPKYDYSEFTAPLNHIIFLFSIIYLSIIDKDNYSLRLSITYRDLSLPSDSDYYLLRISSIPISDFFLYNVNLIQYPTVNKIYKSLMCSPNIILNGAPGTGKTYLAKQVASYIASDKKTLGYNFLDDTQKSRIGFVQFHPSYDYTDFIEGLRPVNGNSGSVEFELQDGVFKKFVNKAKSDPGHNYVFIIDEINRGEISKIFGELFFSIDPGYRGKAGEVSTQYANLHKTDSDGKDSEKFFIPENVYIIGTMNDIDRSVDGFDFAMRRRFRFIEISADQNVGMLVALDKDIRDRALLKMESLNIAIEKVLDKNYQIGAAYFLKLEKVGFYELWRDYLKPLLEEYVRGMPNAKSLLADFEQAYGPEDTIDPETGNLNLVVAGNEQH